MSEEASAVEQYLRAKGYRFKSNGDQINLEVCPVCKDDRWKFYINGKNWLWNCKAGTCGKAGNEAMLKREMGDSLPGVSSMRDGATQGGGGGGGGNAEAIPDIEAAHQRLLENDPVLNYLNDERGFDLDLVKRFKLGLGERNFGDPNNPNRRPALMYPYFRGTSCIGVKYRTLPQSIDPEAPEKKDFRFTNGKENGLYNENAVKPGIEYLILCEGEADALALIAAGFENVVGVPGCEGKKVSWDKALDKPRKLFLLFDRDQYGQEGAYKFAARFGIERFNNILLPEFTLPEPDASGRAEGKDINEWFVAGHTPDELHALMDSARPFDIEGVTSIEDAISECEQDLDANGGVLKPKYSTPWHNTINPRLGGAEDGDLIIILAPPKSCKTTFCLNWADDLVATQGVTTFFDCLEMKAKRLVRKWVSYVTKTDDTPGRSQLSRETFAAARDINKSRTADLLFGHTVLKSEQEAFDRIRAVVRRYGAKVVFFDNLQLLADTTITKGNLGNRVSYLSMLTKKFKQLAMELNIVIVLISQPKRLGEGQVTDSDSTEGSSAPEKDCDAMICFHRAREAKLREADLQKLNNFETDEAFSPKIHASISLSRYSPGGKCSLHLEGAMSWVREYSTEEMTNAAAVKVENSSGITFTDRGLGGAEAI